MVNQKIQFIRMLIAIVMVFALTASLASVSQAQSSAPGDDQTSYPTDTLAVFLPAVIRPGQVFIPSTAAHQVNVPMFTDGVHFSRAAIFWFGRVNPSENYADVRVYAMPDALHVRVSIFDRLLWSDITPEPADFANWDAVTLLVDLDAGVSGGPGTNAYRFDAMLNNQPPPGNLEYQAAYQGNSSGWSPVALDFLTVAGHRWESAVVGGINNNQNNRGWTMTYQIPYSSLGLAHTPTEGTIWNLGVVVNDRESPSQPAQDQKTWPEALQIDQPGTWGKMRFGLKEYQAPTASPAGTLTIREGLAGMDVPDAAVGGTIDNLCPGDPTYIWNQWGEANFGSDPNFNVQNQGDLADWPCFSKYFITFPLDQLPEGQVILEATLQIYLYGNSDPALAQDSLVQVLRVANDWQENTITWNNAPLAIENLAQTVVAPSDYPWPRIPYTWDVSLAVAQAYAEGAPLRLALYSADGAIHSGKYFVGSEDAWVGGEFYRPTLEITWGRP
jgi:hypothetical protein